MLMPYDKSPIVAEIMEILEESFKPHEQSIIFDRYKITNGNVGELCKPELEKLHLELLERQAGKKAWSEHDPQPDTPPTIPKPQLYTPSFTHVPPHMQGGSQNHNSLSNARQCNENLTQQQCDKTQSKCMELRKMGLTEEDFKVFAADYIKFQAGIKQKFVFGEARIDTKHELKDNETGATKIVTALILDIKVHDGADVSKDKKTLTTTSKRLIDLLKPHILDGTYTKKEFTILPTGTGFERNYQIETRIL